MNRQRLYWSAMGFEEDPLIKEGVSWEESTKQILEQLARHYPRTFVETVIHEPQESAGLWAIAGVLRELIDEFGGVEKAI